MFTKNTTLSTDLSTSSPQKRDIFVIFVHFGSREKTDVAIEAALTAGCDPEKIIVVDHSSAPFTPLVPVEVVRPFRNNGYASGLRAGIQYAGVIGAKDADVCVLLNNDLILSPSALRDIAIWWDESGGHAVLAGASWGAVSLLSGRADVVGRLEERSPFVIPYIHGCCMVLEYGFAQQTPFYEDFFMYWEDVAISMRVRAMGGVLAVIPNISVLHNDSIGVLLPDKLYYLVRNGAYVLERLTPFTWRMFWYAKNTLRIFYHIIMGNGHSGIVQALRDARMKKLGQMAL